MALLDWMNERSGPVVQGEGVSLRAPRLTDHGEWADLRALSRDYLQPWEPIWASDDLSRAAFRRRIAIYDREVSQAKLIGANREFIERETG